MDHKNFTGFRQTYYAVTINIVSLKSKELCCPYTKTVHVLIKNLLLENVLPFIPNIIIRIKSVIFFISEKN